MLDKIRLLHKQMKQLTLEANVGPKRYDSLILNLEKKQKQTQERILALLVDVSQNEYFEVHRIWNLPTMTPEVWENYLTIFDDTDFEEVTILKQARRVLKARYATYFRNKQ